MRMWVIHNFNTNKRVLKNNEVCLQFKFKGEKIIMNRRNKVLKHTEEEEKK